MSFSDPIADMLTRIRNGLRARHPAVNVRASKLCQSVAAVLKQEGYIVDCQRIEDGGPQGLLRITLKYGPLGEQVITAIQRVSRPGRRVYAPVEALPRPRNGMGISVVSTSVGVLSDRQCREKKVGGEVLCSVS